LQSLPSRIGNILDITLKDLEKVLYCEAYIVIDAKETGLQSGELWARGQVRPADRGIRGRPLRGAYGRRGDPRDA
jgi:DNA-directed RNA polymerase beta' subunit